MKLSTLFACVAALLVGPLTACTPSGGDAAPEVVASLTALTIEVGSTNIAVGEQLQLTAMGQFDDETSRDVTAEVEWTSSDAAVAEFDGRTPGLLVAVTNGTIEVSARMDGVTSEAAELVIGEVVTELVITPDTVAFERGETAEVSVIAVLADETERDVTAEAEWVIEDPAHATLEGNTLTAVRRGETRLIARYGGVEAAVPLNVICEYPTHNGQIAYGSVFPPLAWEGAYLGDDSQIDFGLHGFHCDPEYDDKVALIVVLGAGWCTACTQYTTGLLNPIAQDLIAEGAEILYVEAQDYNYNPTDNEFARDHLRQMIGDGPGIRVGDSETMAEGQAVPAYIQNQPIVEFFPSVWIVRRSDMRMIAVQENGYLPLPQIIADPEADWSDYPPYQPPFVANCEEADEEIYEPNNDVFEAAPIEAGSFDGGICTEPAVDFYAIGIAGRWRMTLDFSHAQGDIDVVLWDKREDDAVLNGAGEAVGSFSATDREVLEWNGPATVRVYGYNNNSATYRLTLEEL